jgi:DNA-binding response OmpR family regulator
MALCHIFYIVRFIYKILAGRAIEHDKIQYYSPWGNNREKQREKVMIFLEDNISSSESLSLALEHNELSDRSPVLISFLSYKALIFHERFIYIFQRKQMTEGFQLHCTPTQCRLLLAFLSHPEHVLSFSDLAACAFGLDVAHCDAEEILTLQKHVSKLKQKLPPFLKLAVVKGHGYVLHYRKEEDKAGSNHAPE